MTRARLRRAVRPVALAFWGVAVACGPGGTTHHVVEIRALAFEPPALTAAVGDTVTWLNRDIVPHTVDGAAGALASGELTPGGEYSAVVQARGALRYTCRYHPTMEATVTVR